MRILVELQAILLKFWRHDLTTCVTYLSFVYWNSAVQFEEVPNKVTSDAAYELSCNMLPKNPCALAIYPETSSWID